MAFYLVTAGGPVLAEDLNQILNTLNGNAVAPVPIRLAGVYSGIPLDIDVNSLATVFRVRLASAQFLLVGSGGVQLSVRGATFDHAVNETATQTLTNKSMSGAANTFTNLPGAQIAAGTIASAALADGAVTGAKIADEAVAGDKLGYAEAVSLYMSGDFTITDENVWFDIPWQTEEFDYNSGDGGHMHGGGGDPNYRVRIKKDGAYLISFWPFCEDSAEGNWAFKCRIVRGNSTATAEDGTPEERTWGFEAEGLGSATSHYSPGSFVWAEKFLTHDTIKFQVQRQSDDPNTTDHTLEGGIGGGRLCVVRIGKR